MSKKDIYKSMYQNAVIRRIDFEDEEDGRKWKYCFTNISDAKPINGLDLFKACAACGMMINNFDEINSDNNYYLEFVGFSSYYAFTDLAHCKQNEED